MTDFIKYVGLDVHKETIVVSVAEAYGGEVRYLGEMANTPEAVEKLVRQLRKNGARLSFCYEAGPCGYGLHRQLTGLGWECMVVAYLGLVPSEYSSGGSKRRGGITKTGNSHVRRVLVEAAWTYRHAARKTAVLQRRAERTPEVIQDIAWSAQKRLCQKYRALEGKGKLKVQVCTAVARELAGFIWAIGHVMPATNVAAA